MPQRPVLVIAGPTASGKTAVAVEACKVLGGEIISADSMQVYQHLSIGTAKPTPAELQGIPCHLIDHISPDDQYNLGRFVQEATGAIRDIRSRGAVPVLCGGTGMYIRGLLYGVFHGGEPALELRAQLEHIADTAGLQPLYAELQSRDPESARRYGPNDRQRIIRALEVIRSTGRPFSSFHQQDLSNPIIPHRTFILSWPRPLLYERINARVDHMLDQGFLAEVQAYLDRGFRHDNPAINALGYSELIDHLHGRTTLHDALEAMERKSRNYAKRQETWFRSVTTATTISAAHKSAQEIAREIVSQYEILPL